MSCFSFGSVNPKSCASPRSILIGFFLSHEHSLSHAHLLPELLVCPLGTSSSSTPTCTSFSCLSCLLTVIIFTLSLIIARYDHCYHSCHFTLTVHIPFTLPLARSSLSLPSSRSDSSHSSFSTPSCSLSLVSQHAMTYMDIPRSCRD